MHCKYVSFYARLTRDGFGRRGTGLPNPSRETKFSGANADSEILFFSVQLTMCKVGNHRTRLMHTLATCVTNNMKAFSATIVCNTLLLLLFSSH